MEKCFVIQPFDNGKFDVRFNDIFKPAIENAGLYAYRVDEDSSVKVPIENIEKGILASVMCFAEITENNPNVWYELGYAFACGKDVVMVCSDDRKSYPFDIQHRKVIKYTVNSKSDFERLEKEITKTIKAYKTKSMITHELNSTTIQGMEGLESHEVAVLILLTENSISNDDYVPYYHLKQEMEESGYTNIATSVAVRTLTKKNMIVISKEYNEYNGGDPFDACRITEKGEDWVLSNQDKLQFRKNIVEDKIVANNNDLPF